MAKQQQKKTEDDEKSLYHKNGHRKFTMDEDIDPWEIQPGEDPKSFYLFGIYMRMLPHERSLRKVCIQVYGEEEGRTETCYVKVKMLCKRYRWVERVMAYDQYLADIENRSWERRRLEIKEYDFQQGMKIRKIADKILDLSEDFFEDNETYVAGKNGEPDKIIINRKLKMDSALKGVEIASKIHRLVVGESTENVRFSDSAINSLIQKELAKMSNGGDEPDGDEDDFDEEDFDAMNEDYAVETEAEA